VGLSGALIGPPGAARDRGGSMEGAPVYLGCSESDEHIPLASVDETAAFFQGLGAFVDKSIFPGSVHAVNAEELAEFQRLVSAAAVAA